MVSLVIVVTIVGIMSFARMFGVRIAIPAIKKFDALCRPTSRNNDTFGYNARSEVESESEPDCGYGRSYWYDEIGNSAWYWSNCLNQYAGFGYDADGNMVTNANLAIAYDARSRLASVCDAAYTNGEWKTGLLVSNRYDHVGRRVKKITRESEVTFFYDGWNLIEERIAYTNGNTSTIHYYWGKDLSGTLQGAGGVGGLLYLTVSTSSIEPQTPNSSTPNLQLYIPCYDNNGNITRYLDANGNTVAQYTYDAFGNTIGKSGPMCDTFRHRFSTKYFDIETGLYYYGYRFYNPQIMRWLNRDPIGEDGGVNMYAICSNNPKWGDGFASFVTHLRRRAHAQANEHRLKGFKGYFVGYNGMVSWPNEQTQMETVNSENQQQ